MRPSLLRSSRFSLRRPQHPQLPHLRIRFASSAPLKSSADFPQPPQNEPEPTEDPSDDTDKPKSRRTRVSSTMSKDSEPMELPDGLNILWSTEQELMGDSTHTSALPPPELLEEALHNLQITLHPQTQHRATYSTPLGSPVEPTFGLLCPIEGGEYVIDATVRELALRTGAEVLVLDAVQLAAGEWGQFGKAANALQLPRNPLHFPSSSQPPPDPRSVVVEEEDDSESGAQFYSPPQQMTLTLVSSPSMQGRTIMATAPRKSAPPSRIKVFFDTLVNLPSKQEVASSSRTRPRLVYIRDFTTLAPLAASWYPHLLSSIRQRRRGPISRPTSPISNPMTIIFGITPSIAPPVMPQSGPGSGLLSMLLSRQSPHMQTMPAVRSTHTQWGEDETSEKAREKRLRERLKRWEKGDIASHDEYAKLAIGSDPENGPDAKPEIVVIGAGNGAPGFLPILSALSPGQDGKTSDSESKSFFFRALTLVPHTRSPSSEQSTRIDRRREMNELTMRMGIGAVGGCVQKERASDILPLAAAETVSSHHENHMWASWGHTLESWTNVRKIADRALGTVMSSITPRDKLDKETLDPTLIPWPTVQDAWSAHNSMRDFRKAWFKEVSPHTRSLAEDEEWDQTEAMTDEVIERIKNDSELDPHEQKLLACIVDSASMTTTFGQVHLPAHTIDSVRTIVSLPLLHPQAFQQGILREHGMTGCLLFGPPGTGKTLIVRALAKEAGCRMMMISPSDVMDMYVGEGEKLVRAVFSLARKLAPCVIFLDEIDALFGARMSARESGGAFAHRGVITEFMQEMDGLKSSRGDRVIVIGATNRPFDLDDAVLRRLPRRLLVDLPGEREREEILKILLRDEQLAEDVDTGYLAKKTESFSGSDLKHLCVSAALDAVKEHVQLPWSVPKIRQTPIILEASQSSPVLAPVGSLEESSASESVNDANAESAPHARSLHLRNFLKALKEITPSSSESLGSLAELRKWNEEFGEGQKDKKRQQVWGKGRFGFTKSPSEDKADISVQFPSNFADSRTSKG
ncbi:hypothetical protein JOM56_003605 [Amanita muscaria]